MDPKSWGPPTWKSLHSITFGYPHCPTMDDKKNNLLYFTLLQHVLPCITCRDNYKKHLNKYPLTNDILSSRIKFIKWLIDIHNEVNIMLGKPTKSYEEVINKYETQNNNWFIIVIVGLIILLSIIYYLYRSFS